MTGGLRDRRTISATGSFKVGVIWPATGLTFDDLQAFCPSNAELVKAPLPSPGVTTYEVAVDLAKDLTALELAARELTNSGISSCVFACTCASFVLGRSAESDQVRNVERVLGVPATTTSRAMVIAARSLGAKRVVVASPYEDRLTQAFVLYLKSEGFEIDGWRSLEMVDDGLLGTLESKALLELISTAVTPAADAVLMPDTAVHTFDLVGAWGGRFPPLVTANQASVWHASVLAGIPSWAFAPTSGTG